MGGITPQETRGRRSVTDEHRLLSANDGAHGRPRLQTSGAYSATLMSMSADSIQRRITGRIFRNGEPMSDAEDIASTPAERIEAVWEITLQCLGWQKDQTGEPRLQRSVSRVQRPRG
jgi:hypothetical protein